MVADPTDQQSPDAVTVILKIAADEFFSQTHPLRMARVGTDSGSVGNKLRPEGKTSLRPR